MSRVLLGDLRGQFLDVEAEIQFFAQLNGHRLGADEVDHRLVDREAGIGVDDLVAFFGQRGDGVEHDRLAAGNDDHLFRRDLDVARARDVIGDRLAEFGQARRWAVVRPALVQGVAAGFDDVGGRVEIGLADFQVNNALALRFQGTRPDQHFEGGLGAQPRHPLGQTQCGSDTSCFFHSGSSHYIAPFERLGRNSSVSAGGRGSAVIGITGRAVDPVDGPQWSATRTYSILGIELALGISGGTFLDLALG